MSLSRTHWIDVRATQKSQITKLHEAHEADDYSNQSIEETQANF